MLVSVIAAAVIIVANWWVERLNDQWNEFVLGTQCLDIPPLPSVAGYGWAAGASAVVLLSSYGGWVWTHPGSLRGIGRAVVTVTVGFLAVVIALFGLWLAAATIDSDSTPYSGPSGSGLPCGSG